MKRGETVSWALIGARLKVILVLLILALTLYGGISVAQSGSELPWDSVKGLLAAQSYHAGYGFFMDWVYDLDPNHSRPFWTWTPLFPFITAMLMHLGLDSVFAAGIFPVLCFVFLLLLLLKFSTRFGFRAAGLPVLIVTASLAILWKFATSAMTEMPFIFFCVFSLYALTLYLKSSDPGKTRIFLFSAAGLVSCAVLTRYHGIALIPVGGLIILIKNIQRWKSLALHVIHFLAITLIPVSIWMYRNVLIVGRATTQEGGRADFGRLIGNIPLTFKILYQDFFGTFDINIFYVSIFFVVLFGSLIIGRKRLLRVLVDYFTVLLFIAVYWGGLLYSMSKRSKPWPPMDYRYMIPLYPLFILLFFSLVVLAAQSLRAKVWRAVYVGIIVVLSLLIVIPQAGSSVDLYKKRKTMEGNLDFNCAGWRDNQGIRWAQENIPQDEFVYLYSGRSTALILSLRLNRPTRALQINPRSSDPEVHKTALYKRLTQIVDKARSENKSLYLILFKKAVKHWSTADIYRSSYYVEAMQLEKEFPDLAVAADFEDSTIFRMVDGQ